MSDTVKYLTMEEYKQKQAKKLQAKHPLFQPEYLQPKEVSYPSPWRPGEKEEMEALQQQWEALFERGEHEGWIKWTNDPEGSIPVVRILKKKHHPTRTETRLETPEELAERLSTLEEEKTRLINSSMRDWPAYKKAQEKIFGKQK